LIEQQEELRIGTDESRRFKFPVILGILAMRRVSSSSLQLARIYLSVFLSLTHHQNPDALKAVFTLKVPTLTATRPPQSRLQSSPQHLFPFNRLEQCFEVARTEP
jgi:hypothetical protein